MSRAPRKPPERSQGLARKRARGEASSTAATLSLPGLLSTDILRIIFAYVPPRPRIVVLSRVCKRWRELAFASITELPRCPSTCHASFSGLLHLFPNLEVMPELPNGVVDNEAFWAALPPLKALKKLRIPDSNRSIRADVEFLRRRTSIVDVSLSACTIRSLVDAGLRVCRFTAITSLAITPSPNEFLKVAPAVVQSASFPQLSAFDLHDNTRPSIGKQILTLHMSRLRSLHITQEPEIPRSSFSELLSGLLFPHLESFTLRSRNGIALSDMLSTLAVATPALTSLSLIDLALVPSAAPPRTDTINSLMPTLRDVSIRNVTGGLHLPPLGSTLVSLHLPYLTQLEYGCYPRLTSLSVIDVFPVAIVQSTVAVLSRLRHLVVQDLHAETVQHLFGETGLVALSVTYFPDAMFSLTSAFMRDWRLPNLQKLALTQHETSNSRCNTVALLLRLLASDSHWPFQRLRHLKLSVGDTNTRAERRDVISDLLNCIDKLERLGVERVTIKGLERNTEKDFREQLSVKRRELRWLELLF